MTYIGVFANSFWSINNLSKAHFEWPYSAILSNNKHPAAYPTEDHTRLESVSVGTKGRKKGFKLNNLVQRKIMPTILNWIKINDLINCTFYLKIIALWANIISLYWHVMCFTWNISTAGSLWTLKPVHLFCLIHYLWICLVFPRQTLWSSSKLLL